MTVGSDGFACQVVCATSGALLHSGTGRSTRGRNTYIPLGRVSGSRDFSGLPGFGAATILTNLLLHSRRGTGGSQDRGPSHIMAGRNDRLCAQGLAADGTLIGADTRGFTAGCGSDLAAAFGVITISGNFPFCGNLTTGIAGGGFLAGFAGRCYGLGINGKLMGCDRSEFAAGRCTAFGTGSGFQTGLAGGGSYCSGCSHLMAAFLTGGVDGDGNAGSGGGVATGGGNGYGNGCAAHTVDGHYTTADRGDAVIAGGVGHLRTAVSGGDVQGDAAHIIRYAVGGGAAQTLCLRRCRAAAAVNDDLGADRGIVVDGSSGA